MAVDDFNADGYADIAAALPIAGTGLVLILPGGPRRVTLVDARRLAPPDGDHHVYPESFGNSLTSFDSNGDHVADLVAGAATSNVRSKYQAGVLYVLPGGVTGLSMADSRCFRESSPAFGGRSRHDHRFGYVGPSAGIFDYP